MLISIQFPFADLRKFLVNPGQLSLPGWPLPVPDTQFVRHFGSIRLRRLGGIEGWVGENEICEADRALRFCGNVSFIDHHSPFQLSLRCAFRRLYFDGWAVGKFEVGVSPKKRSELNLPRDQSGNLLTHILRFPVQVRNSSGDTQSCELINAGRYLARSYLAATTAHNSPINRQDWWVRHGTPLVFLHYNEQERIQLPYWARPIRLTKQYELQLLQCQVPYNRGANVRMWVLGPAQRSWVESYHEERALRICLLRLHAEHECLRLILRDRQTKNITIIPRSRESDNLQHYLNNATARIGRLEAESVKQFDTEIKAFTLP